MTPIDYYLWSDEYKFKHFANIFKRFWPGFILKIETDLRDHGRYVYIILDDKEYVIAKIMRYDTDISYDDLYQLIIERINKEKKLKRKRIMKDLLTIKD